MSIWQYINNFNPYINPQHRISLNEGNTRCDKCNQLSSRINLDLIYLKREDLNPTGSFKDRSLAFQMAAHLQEGKNSFIISSSGNAAISAIHFSQKIGCELHVFVSTHTPLEKTARLMSASHIENYDKRQLLEGNSFDLSYRKITLHFSQKPKSNAIKFEKRSEAVNLRGSTDDYATVGFQTIAYELQSQCVDADALFIPCSSGTSTVGINTGYAILNKKPPPIHIVQTSKIHPIAKVFDADFSETKTSIATAISDRVSHRKETVLNIINDSKGFGWVVDDKQISEAQGLFKQLCNLEVSADAALSLAGLQKALSKGFHIKRPILLISGK